MKPPVSFLDLTPIRQGGRVADTFAEAVALAQLAEARGFHRYWLVEHHNTPGVGGSATSVLIGHIAGATKTIRVGAGGILLPNHAPLKVAEQFGTLVALYGDRIDLGLGRGINNDPATMQALRRVPGDMARFPDDVQELLGFLGPDRADHAVRAVPGQGSNVPVWILTSSLGGASLAASLGLPCAYASHFAPDQLEVALTAYRGRFQPSAAWKKPHLMLSLAVVVADSDAEARYLFSSVQQASDGELPPPVRDYESRIDPQRLALLNRAMRYSLVGSPETAARGFADFVARHQPDEVIVTSQIFDAAARRRSLELFADAVL